jgi:hypothetical protein
MRLTQARRLPLLLLAALLLTGHPCAEELPKEKGPARTVKMFDMFCLTQLPDLEGIERFAGFGEFAPLSRAELEAHEPATPAERLIGWRFHDFGAEMILTASRSAPDEDVKQRHPAFAKGKSVACALLLPGGDPPAEIVRRLARRLGREPDEQREEAGGKVWVWNAASDKAVSQVRYQVPAEAGGKAALSASAVVKN